MITTFILTFLANFGFILLKAFQQLNVMHDKYWWIMPVSTLLALGEVYVIAKIAQVGFGWIVVPIALGGGLGCMLGMYLHNRWRK